MTRTFHLKPPFPRRALFWILALFLLPLRPAAAAGSAKRHFDLPAGNAEDSLKRFGEQSGREVLFPADLVAGVHTRAVKGEMTPEVALDSLLAGTPLVGVLDQKTGALTVQREKSTAEAEKKDGRTAPATNGDRPGHKSNEPAPEPKNTNAAGKPAASEGATQADLNLMDERVILSPFEVVSDQRGYFASNTMSGTRVNSKLEDLGASVSILTRDQMNDFAMTDINDIFKYEVSTEGTKNFTDFAFDRFGNQTDNVSSSPQTSNRIRGQGAANTAVGNFQTLGRVPIDAIDVESVEISRGPNASIFGLGNASGTVNVIPIQANLRRQISQVTFRADSYSGYRGTLDVNRTLIKDKLAIRGTFVQQREGFARKPSGVNSERFNYLIKYQPFKWTTLRANATVYSARGNRPNALTPLESISYWRASGSPTWDPFTKTAYNGNGTVYGSVGQYTTTLPAFFLGAPLVNSGTIYSNPWVFVDRSGIGLWSASATSPNGVPNTANGTGRFVETSPDPTVRLNQPLFANNPPLTDKSIYDYSKINLFSPNDLYEATRTLTAELDQFIVNTPMHQLALQLGFYREDDRRFQRSELSAGTAVVQDNVLNMDVNRTLLDGRPNPYYLRPYIGAMEPSSRLTPARRNIYRTQLAYKLDFTTQRSWLKWLGLHQVSLYDEYRETVSRFFLFRDAVVDVQNHPAWIIPGTSRPGTSATANGTKMFFKYYLGDATGSNVDYAPGRISYGNYTFNYMNSAPANVTAATPNGIPVAEQVQLGLAAGQDGSANSGIQSGSSSRNILKTSGVVVQSHLWKDRIVTTLGVRKDKQFVTQGVASALTPDQLEYNYDITNRFTGIWTKTEGTTRTQELVVKPLRWLSLYGGAADSFLPSNPAQTVLLRPLGSPTGHNEEYGATMSFFDGKLVLRGDQYRTKQVGIRNGNIGQYGQRSTRIDIAEIGGDTFSLSRQASAWIQAANPNLSASEVRTRVLDLMKMTDETYQALKVPLPGLADTQDVISKGRELEVAYNDKNWSVRANFAKLAAIDANLGKDVNAWIAQRMPIWTSIVDPRTNTPWWTTPYGGTGTSATASTYYIANVGSVLQLAEATEGKSRPQIRKYRVNVSGNYRLSGITENRFLKRVSIGGGIRWEDRGAIGYYGLQQPPAQVTAYDPSRPIYDKAHTYYDAFWNYKVALFANKVTAKFQLNIENLTEGGRLQPTAAYPNGVPSAYRIIDPRKFTFSTIFDF